MSGFGIMIPRDVVTVLPSPQKNLLPLNKLFFFWTAIIPEIALPKIRLHYFIRQCAPGHPPEWCWNRLCKWSDVCRDLILCVLSTWASSELVMSLIPSMPSPTWSFNEIIDHFLYLFSFGNLLTFLYLHTILTYVNPHYTFSKPHHLL